MARYKHYDYAQTKMLPISFDRQILPGTFEYTLNHLIDEKIDLSIFEKRYNNDDGGAPAYDDRRSEAALERQQGVERDEGGSEEEGAEDAAGGGALAAEASGERSARLRRAAAYGGRTTSEDAERGDREGGEVSRDARGEDRPLGPARAEQPHGQRVGEDADQQGAYPRIDGFDRVFDRAHLAPVLAGCRLLSDAEAALPLRAGAL
jgi:hypothetical protein